MYVYVRDIIPPALNEPRGHEQGGTVVTLGKKRGDGGKGRRNQTSRRQTDGGRLYERVAWLDVFDIIGGCLRRLCRTRVRRTGRGHLLAQHVSQGAGRGSGGGGAGRLQVDLKVGSIEAEAADGHGTRGARRRRRSSGGCVVSWRVEAVRGRLAQLGGHELDEALAKHVHISRPSSRDVLAILMDERRVVVVLRRQRVV